MKKSVRHCDARALELLYAECLERLRADMARFSMATDGFLKPFPMLEQVNPPLWEFGHVAWFTEHWVTRNPKRRMGRLLDAPQPSPSRLAQADRLFNSATIPHDERWQLDQLGEVGVTAYLEACFSEAVSDLARDAHDETDLYFHRLSLAHACMHLEAFEMTAQTLGLARGVSEPPKHNPSSQESQQWISVPAQRLHVAPPADQFHFDNERSALEADLQPFQIDQQPVSMALFWAFVDDGGYDRPSLWSAAGWKWRETADITGPLHLRHNGTRLQCRLGDQWQDARPNQPMVHVCLHEAQAWCNWAGRRLPTEAEWAAAGQAGMAWGDVWEWTSSPFLPFMGFEADPYVEYSAPWFGDHWVLKGASIQTHVALKDLHYRNFYRPHRRDVFAGFRSVQADASGTATNSANPAEVLR